MEDIEYLEEYEDLVLPALNSAAAVAAASSTSFQANKNSQIQKINNDGDDSSSSLDQDIFNCLFDDNSDDDDFNNYENIDKESAIKTKIGSRESFDNIEEKIQELGEKVLEKVEISRQEQSNNNNTTLTNTTGTNPKHKTLMTKTSGTTVSLNTRPQTSLSKTKSIATVRPTVQNQKQEISLQKISNLSQTPTTAASTSSSSIIQRQNPSTSGASTSSRSVQLPNLVNKASPSRGSLPSSSGVLNKKPDTSITIPGSAIVIKKIDGKRQATIIKPEKIITKDPANDPLELDDFSEPGSTNYSSSDISGDTYNSFSNFEDESVDEFYSGDDFDDDDASDDDPISSSSHIIELSNDSSSAVSNLNKKKKTFKEPLVVKATTGHLTPKPAKIDKPVSKTLSSNSKRPLRYLDLETESPTSSKKIKLDIIKKPTRLRNILNDCLDEEELPIVTTKDIIASKEQQHLLEKPAVVDKQKLNVSPKIVFRAVYNTTAKEVKDTSKNTAISEKKAEELVKHAEKPPQTAVNVEQKERSNEASKQTVSSTGSKHIVSAKKATNSKEEKADNVKIASESPKQPKIMKTNVNITAKKSPGSAVISFTDWLKTKKQSTVPEVAEKTVTAKESSSDIAKRQSRIETKSIDPRVSQVKDTTTQIVKVTQSETTMMCQNKDQVSDSKEIQEKKDAIAEKGDISRGNDDRSMNISQQISSSLSLSHGNEAQNAKKGNRKVNVKRLQTANTSPKRSPKIQLSPVKSNTETTSHRIKKTETDLLIEAMPKEMKDGGINYLLKSEENIKRQRLPSRRKLNITTGQSNINAPIIVRLNKSIPKVVDFSENMEIPPSKDTNRSPTRRRPQQNSSKSGAYPTMMQRQPSSASDHTIRKSLNIKELSQQIENTTNFSTALVKTRKSMPILSRETLDKAPNVSFRKTLSKEQSELAESNIFKVPKPTGTSTVLNKIKTPTPENVKKLYPVGGRRIDRRFKRYRRDALLKKFNCRKVTVRLDRSLVEKYLKSEKYMSTRESPVSASGSEVVPTTFDRLPILQNNSESSLRIQSVVDASTILNNTSSSSVMLSTPAVQPNTNSLHGTSVVDRGILLGVDDAAVPLNPSDINETFELKNEFVDENIEDSILPDTPTLLARAQTIKEAAQHALSNSVTPTDIRLLTTDSSENSFVPSFGVTPRAVDNKGTSIYTFLHPAKYNRNHSNVLLDYCCPNLNGPMPAIDPTRIHAQVQVPVMELPASIVLTTKVVTRSDLENGSSAVPEIIRKKAEKIRKNMATHHKMAVSTSTASTHPTPTASVMAPTVPNLTPRASLPPTINALTKQLPSTTTITAKIRPPLPQISQQSPSGILPSAAPKIPNSAIVSVIPKGHSSQLTNVQVSSMRSNLRRFDVLLKQLVQPYESLSFVQRHHIIEAIISSGKYMNKDLEQILLFMEEYVKQTMLVKPINSLKQSPITSATALLSKSNYTTSQAGMVSSLSTAQMPQLQPSPKMLASSAAPVVANTYSSQFEQIRSKAVRKVQSKDKNTSSTSTVSGGPSAGVVMKQRQVPIYDTDRNIIGYQMQNTPVSTIPSHTKSTISTHSTNNKITEYHISKRPMKRPAQDSPRVFYTTPPLKTSTPKAITSTDVYQSPHHAKNSNTISQKTQKRHGSIVTTVRSGSSTARANSETITTTTMATVKRVTRSTATGSKLIVFSKSNQSCEETILPDANNSQHTEQTEIKNEKDIEDFLD